MLYVTQEGLVIFENLNDNKYMHDTKFGHFNIFLKYLVLSNITS